MFITEAPGWLGGGGSGGSSEFQDELGLVSYHHIMSHDWTGLGFIFPIIAVSSHHIGSSHGTAALIITDFLQSAQRINIELHWFTIHRSIQ